MTLRYNFSTECENMINQLFKKQMELSYCFLSKVDYFTKYDVGLDGFAMWADWMGDRMYTWARQLISYQNLRGGNVVYVDLAKPKVGPNEKVKCILSASLGCFNDLFENYNQLSRKALEQGDGQTSQFVEAHFINEILVDLRFIAEASAKLQDVKEGSSALAMLDQSLRNRFSSALTSKKYHTACVPATCYVKKFKQTTAGNASQTAQCPHHD